MTCIQYIYSSCKCGDFSVRFHSHTFIHICTYVCVHIYIYTYVVYICTYVHICMHFYVLTTACAIYVIHFGTRSASSIVHLRKLSFYACANDFVCCGGYNNSSRIRLSVFSFRKSLEVVIGGKSMNLLFCIISFVYI